MSRYSSIQIFTAGAALRLRAFGKWAGQFPSMGFGLAYLAAIPLFAALYIYMPFDFYNNTARYEPLVQAQKNTYAHQLREYYLAAGPSLNQKPVMLSQDKVFPIMSI